MGLLQLTPLKNGNAQAKDRYLACLGCKARQRFLFNNWCGVPMVGGDYNPPDSPDEPVRLCGCLCKEKAKVDEERCPLGRWPETTPTK